MKCSFENQVTFKEKSKEIKEQRTTILGASNDKEDSSDTTQMSIEENNTRQEDENKTGAVPSVRKGGILEVCKVDQRGLCVRHGCEMEMIMVSSKKWGMLGRNKGYGYKYMKTKKYICRDKDIHPQCQDENRERFCEESSSSQNSSEGNSGLLNIEPGVLEHSTRISGAGSKLDED